MRANRVVITGMGAVSPFGEGVAALTAGLGAGRCALRPLEDGGVAGMHCRVAGRVPSVDAKRIPRDLRRAMSPMAIYACLAAREALAQAGLDAASPLPRTGVAVGSTLGSPQTLHTFFAEFLQDYSVEHVRSTVFFKIMGHTAASSVALDSQCTGRMLAPAAACASGLLGIGLGYECIAAGREERMLCGGSDEFHLLTAATFDRLGAASHATDPLWASRPFDAARDGVVCSEGAGILLLESLESALARKAPILGEVRGFALRTSPNIAQPDTAGITDCMREALDDAKLRPGDIGCVNAHATATRQGDAAEGQAIAALFGEHTPVQSLKGHMGHTMAACGALESIACVEMLRSRVLWPTLGLTHPDPACGRLAHVTQTRRQSKVATSLLKNCFALGGSVCCLILNIFHE